MSKFLDQDGLLYFWGKIKDKLSTKVDKVDGKALSSNDFTNELLTKLNGIDSEANKTTIANNLTTNNSAQALSAAQGVALKNLIDGVDEKFDDYALSADIPTKVSELDNDSNYLTSADVSDKLNTTGNGSDVTVSFTQAITRTNVSSGQALKISLGKIAKFFADLKSVAFSGSYNDLSDKPSIPVVTNDLTNTLKANYDAAYTHSQSAHAPSGAQANVIETVKVNGAALTVTSKAVNISVPTVTNDLTDALKSNYDAAYTYSQETHAPVDAQANVIESIKVNNSALTVSSKSVNITVPTTVAELTDASDYAKKSDITSMYKFMGSVATVEALPTTGNVAGHVYNVEASGMNYAWTGSEWDALGEIFSIASITNTEIDTILSK